MAKDRILGSSTTIELFPPTGGVMSLEVDSFSSAQKHTTKQRQPLGQVGQTDQVIYVGYDLDFKVGKTDDTAAKFFATIDKALLAGQAAPRIRVVETIKHFDGNNEVWIYPDAVLFGYKNDDSQADDEIKEEFKGTCRTKVQG